MLHRKQTLGFTLQYTDDKVRYAHAQSVNRPLPAAKWRGGDRCAILLHMRRPCRSLTCVPDQIVLPGTHARPFLGAIRTSSGSLGACYYKMTSTRMLWLKVGIQLMVLCQVSQSVAVPTSLQKDVYDFGEDDEPLYAYVYKYEDENQIWSDCSKLISTFITQ